MQSPLHGWIDGKVRTGCWKSGRLEADLITNLPNAFVWLPPEPGPRKSQFAGPLTKQVSGDSSDAWGSNVMLSIPTYPYTIGFVLVESDSLVSDLQ